MISRRSLLRVLPLLPAARWLRGQQQDGGAPQLPTFSASVKVINVLATVRDKKGQIVKSLTKSDFLLDEDGSPQTIAYFSQESNLPLTLGLLVDTSGSVASVLPDERSASYKFLEQVLREDRDLAFVIHFDFEVELLQDLTASRALLEKAIDLLEVGQNRNRQRQQGGGGYPGGGRFPGGGRYPGGGGSPRSGGTMLYDSILLASDELMKKQTGRKALILLTDGEDQGSKVTLAAAIEAAQRADTLIYSLMVSGEQFGNFGGFGGGGRRRGVGGVPRVNRPSGKQVLQQLSSATGGRFFEVSHSKNLDKTFAAIEEDLRNQYNLGYTSNKPASSDTIYRRIHLTTRQKGLVVQTRDGYYAS